MTNTHSPPTAPSRLEQRLDWARRTLELPPEAGWGDVRARMLRLVTGEDFVPPEGAAQAFRTLEADALGVAELDDPPAFVRQQEGELQQAAAEFAAGMFKLPVAERKSKWQRLLARTEHLPRARAWVERLSPGLAVDFGELNTKSELAQQLARGLGELFLLRPTAKAARRAEFLAVLKEKRTQWDIAARQLRQQHPEIAALDPALIDQLLAPQAPLGTGPRIQLPPARRGENSTSDSRFVWIFVVVLIMIAARLPAILGNRPPARPVAPPPASFSSERIREILDRAESKQPPLPQIGPLGPEAPFDSSNPLDERHRWRVDAVRDPFGPAQSPWEGLLPPAPVPKMEGPKNP